MPQIIEGFPSYAPELAKNNEGFNPDNFTMFAKLEANNF